MNFGLTKWIFTNFPLTKEIDYLLHFDRTKNNEDRISNVSSNVNKH